MQHQKVLKVEIRPLPVRKLTNGVVDHNRVLAGPEPVGRESCKVEATAALDTLSRLLSQRNLELLRLIKRAEPQSVAELARLSGRPKASLMLTLRRLAHFGIVTFDVADERRKVPRVSCDKLLLEVAIDPVRPLNGESD
ncbi:MAG: helix-turn-helix domain-containing protein [Hyphomicrobiaceae bacterium]|nr:helix-turn-helix domain-containing protein [Hyphomicrobiaceae bacterium]